MVSYLMCFGCFIKVKRQRGVMERDVYLDRLLTKFSSSFNVYMPYVINGIEYKAYAYFYSHEEKYVLTRSANLWSADSYEHILFMDAEVIDEELIWRAQDIIANYFEPEFVRKGEKYPAQNHMCTYLTVVLLGNHFSNSKLASQVKKYRFDKGYQFGIRGYSAGRLVAVTMDDEKVVHNKAAHKTKKVYEAVFDEVRANKPGFSEICEKQGVTPFKQE